MSPKDFHHPFKPYNIQQQFMEQVYDCIEKGQVGIFESPTGTGKSLSLICGSLTWLREHKRNAFDEALVSIALEGDEPDWVIEQARSARKRELSQLRIDLETRLEAIRQHERNIRDRVSSIEPLKKRHKQADQANLCDLDEEQFVLDDYDSENEDTVARATGTTYSSETLGLLERLGILQKPKQISGSNLISDEPKIFFCSRTHSQLSQLVGELQRVNLPPSLPPENLGLTEGEHEEPQEPLKHLPLGSRKSLCINPKVANLPNQNAVNERCIELQQRNTPSDQKCSFLPTKESEDLVLDFRYHSLARIRDIEDLASIGTKLQICPYYASRPAITSAEIVTLPYQLLLQKSARDALGISLKDDIVIVDEAHNLIDAIEGIYSVDVSEQHLNSGREALITYLQKFRNRLKGSNRIYVAQTVRLIDSLLACITDLRNTGDMGGTLSPAQLLTTKAADQINLPKLIRYIQDSKLARKVEGYCSFSRMTKTREIGRDVKASIDNSHDVPNLMHVQNFFMTISNPAEEGQFFWSKDNNKIVLKYLLLDPSEHFRDIVDNSRAVILAGGTMSPIEAYQMQLFPYLQSIRTLSCGHLIPPSNLLVRIIASDAEGPLEFSFKNRSQASVASRLGDTIQKLGQCTTGGLVIFFPSYGYLEQTLEVWQQRSIMQNISTSRPVFCDSRNGSAEETFKAYNNSIKVEKKAAILLSVIGGKLSEGINFSDDLGRCVLVVGLPFPNLETPGWRAKLQYIDTKAKASGNTSGQASRTHAENICMRSVNQAIGRVIRHKDDWASIILMDARYKQARIQNKLPGWISTSLPEGSPSKVDQVTRDVTDYFRRRVSKNSS